MATEHNVALVRHAVEAIWNRGELELADAVFAPDYVNHGGLIIDLVRGPEAIKASVALYRRAFPALQITVDEVHADGDRVVLTWVARSTAAAAVSGHAPHETHGTLTGKTISRIADGRIVESWTHWDQGAVLEHVGLIPPQDVAGAGPVDVSGLARRRPER